MNGESELSLAKARCDQAFKNFMEMNVLVAEHSQGDPEIAKNNFFEALDNFHDAFKKYTELQKSNIWEERVCNA